jgi:hypothetical protein
MSLLPILLAALAPDALAAPSPTAVGAHRHAFPAVHESGEDVAAGWRRVGDHMVAPVRWEPASRVALALRSGTLTVEARGRNRDGTFGPWRTVAETHRQGEDTVRVAELDGTWEGAELRIPRAQLPTLTWIGWDALVPAYPEAGARARALAAEAARSGPTRTPILRSELAAIGVVSRAEWGARPTTCSDREDDWYRMAIHHTAGNPTYGGTVEGAVQFLQAYSQDGGTYCDIPYQFLVGVDGSLWEGREDIYYSGATYGNNDGDIAVSFLGCFTPSGCPGSTTDVTEEMIAGGNVLVQTLAGMHAISMSDVRGHKDWSGWDHTSCPGDWLYARLDDLRAPLDTWAGALVGTNLPDAPVQIALGATWEGWFDLQNTGTTTWSPGSTLLATIPRDTESPLYDASWVSPTRLATVTEPVAPGGTGRFTFTLRGNTPGRVDAPLGLVQEGVTWFADDGGPSDGSLALQVEVSEAPQDDTASDSGLPEVGVDDSAAEIPGSPARIAASGGGCACAVSERGSWGGGGPAPLRNASPGAVAAGLLWGWLRRRQGPARNP